MRLTSRLLAAVRSGHYLEPGKPTGLTGLTTHPSPRSYLLYVYGSTLQRLKELPESSVYRQSTEALTRHRMQIVESTKPEGYEEWKKRAHEKIEKYPEKFAPGNTQFGVKKAGDHTFITTEFGDEVNIDTVEWDGAPDLERPQAGGAGDFNALASGSAAPDNEDLASERAGLEKEDFASEIAAPTKEDIARERAKLKKDALARKKAAPDNEAPVEWESEPPLDVSQIGEIEEKIGGGLIEEVIQVAEGELKLVETMRESRAWEELEEKPAPGQWEYFSRDTHTKGTQEPPK